MPITNLSLSLLIVLLYSCTTIPKKEEKRSASELAEEKTIHDIDQLLEDLPPPSLVPFTLKSINASFSRDLINSLERAGQYQGNDDKMALNMGVYASDISYLAAYGHEEDCLGYLKVAHRLATDMGDSAIYTDEQLALFQGHIKDQNEEEIAKILSQLFLKTSVQMEEDHHLTMAGLALTGSFIEGLYQAVVTIEKFSNTEANEKLLEPLVKIVLGEEKALLDMITVLKDIPFDDTIADIITELAILDQLYKNDLQKVEEKIANDPDFVLTRDVMRDITLEVKRIRKSIIE